MRLTPAFLIIRLLLNPVFWLVMIILFVFGGIANIFDTKNHDYVCFGQSKFDYNDEEDRQKLFADLGRVNATSDLLQQPPCNLFGSRWYPPEVRAKMLERFHEMAAHPDQLKAVTKQRYHQQEGDHE